MPPAATARLSGRRAVRPVAASAAAVAQRARRGLPLQRVDERGCDLELSRLGFGCRGGRGLVRVPWVGEAREESPSPT